MSRALILCLLLALVPAWGQLKKRDDSLAPKSSNGGLVDEDEDVLKDTTYAFNPIQAQKELKIGAFYAKKGNHRAASARFLEATKWNPSYAEAFWRLGQSREELKQYNLAIEAYRKFLKLDPDGKDSKDAQKRISRLEPLLNLPAPADANANAPDRDTVRKILAGQEPKPSPPNRR